jgi:hypothetical protein
VLLGALGVEEGVVEVEEDGSGPQRGGRYLAR